MGNRQTGADGYQPVVISDSDFYKIEGTNQHQHLPSLNSDTELMRKKEDEEKRLKLEQELRDFAEKEEMERKKKEEQIKKDLEEFARIEKEREEKKQKDLLEERKAKFEAEEKRMADEHQREIEKLNRGQGDKILKAMMETTAVITKTREMVNDYDFMKIYYKGLHEILPTNNKIAEQVFFKYAFEILNKSYRQPRENTSNITSIYKWEEKECHLLEKTDVNFTLQFGKPDYHIVILPISDFGKLTKAGRVTDYYKEFSIQYGPNPKVTVVSNFDAKVGQVCVEIKGDPLPEIKDKKFKAELRPGNCEIDITDLSVLGKISDHYKTYGITLVKLTFAGSLVEEIFINDDASFDKYLQIWRDRKLIN